MAGGGCVEHDDALSCGVDRTCERSEYCDLLGARRAQILFEKGAAFLVEPGRGVHDLRGVVGGLDSRIDALDDEPVKLLRGKCVGDVRRWVGG